LESAIKNFKSVAKAKVKNLFNTGVPEFIP